MRNVHKIINEEIVIFTTIMGSMVKIVDMKVYRKIYLNFLTIMTIMSVASFLLVRNGFYIHWDIGNTKNITDIFLWGMIGVAIPYSFYLRRLKGKMQLIIDFDKKLAFHRRFFSFRMWWSIVSGAISCFLYLLTTNRFFFWFVLFDFLSLLIVFPNRFSLKRELNDDEIIFL